MKRSFVIVAKNTHATFDALHGPKYANTTFNKRGFVIYVLLRLRKQIVKVLATAMHVLSYLRNNSEEL